MENQTKNEPVVINKWHTRLKKWRNRGIILGVIYGLWWLFFPLLSVYDERFMTGVNLGEYKTMTDYYYVNIGGITYAKDKFYVLLSKPYLFNQFHGYTYSSYDLVSWKLEDDGNVRLSSIIKNYPDKLYVDSDGYVRYKDDDSIATTGQLPRQVGNDCFIINSQQSYVSTGCNKSWKQYKFFDDDEIKQLHTNSHEDSVARICSYINNTFTAEKATYLQKFFCLPALPKQNIKAYKVLQKLVQQNGLNLLFDGENTTYGDGKYVGIFYKNKQYYFIISTDGVHYEIKNAPEELTSSLAIKLFN